MTSIAALVLAAAAALGAGGDRAEPRGVQSAVAQVQARILQPAIVRQATGPDQADRRAPAPQISRRGRTVLVEYQ